MKLEWAAIILGELMACMYKVVRRRIFGLLRADGARAGLGICDARQLPENQSSLDLFPCPGMSEKHYRYGSTSPLPLVLELFSMHSRGWFLSSNRVDIQCHRSTQASSRYSNGSMNIRSSREQWKEMGLIADMIGTASSKRVVQNRWAEMAYKDVLRSESFGYFA